MAVDSLDCAKLEPMNTNRMNIKEELSDGDSDSLTNELRIVQEEDEEDYKPSMSSGLNALNSNLGPIKIEILPSSSESEVSKRIESEKELDKQLISTQIKRDIEEEEFVFATVQTEVHPSHLEENLSFFLPHPSLRRNLIPGSKIIKNRRKGRCKVATEESEGKWRREKPGLDASDRQGKYQCGHCSFSADNTSSLKRHSASHTNEKPFVCAICGHRCNQKANLQTHMITHTDLKPYQCRICSFRSKLKGNVKKHEIKYHRDVLD